MKSKKAQAAMEFLMTYGWMILIVLVAIGALYYLGVFSPGKYVPARCEFYQAGFTCLDYKVNTSGVSLYLGQNLGKSINVTNVTLAAVSCSGISPSTPFTMNSGDKQNIVLSCSGISGDNFNSDITIKYKDLDTGYEHVAHGKISAPVE